MDKNYEIMKRTFTVIIEKMCEIIKDIKKIVFMEKENDSPKEKEHVQGSFIEKK